MNSSTSVVTLSFLLLFSVAASALEADRDYQVGYCFDRIQRLTYDESNPLRPQYNYGRIFSSRHLARTGAAFNDIWRVNLILGSANVETHSGEGETVQYDESPIFGFEAEYVFDERPWPGFSVVLLGRYMTASFKDSNVSAVALNGQSAGSKFNLDWTEIAVSGLLRYGFEKIRLLAGLEYAILDIEQNRTFADGSPSVSSSLDPEQDIGVVTGVEYEFSDEWQAGFTVSMFHQIRFLAGVAYSF